mmetsp:Transcript_5854/g.16672  ORF Transcript_5854/g.16672 Transcript_5854/m.16672 type:complete len:1575 (+) Transcript_5854:419-5143(+)
MSSLRLALKQSLEESGGGKFFSGHGDKKKRKKKKTGTESAPSSNGEKSGTTSNSSNTFSLKGSKSGSQRKRGRPRKHSRAQSDESSRRNPHPEDEDGEFSSENEFSLEYSEGETEEYDDDSDDDEVEDSDEDDDDEVHRRHRRNRRRRSGRRREDEEEEFQDVEDEDDEDMEDEITQSEEDELHSRPPMEEKRTHSTGTPAREAGTDTSALDPDRGKSQPPSGPDDGSAAVAMTQRPSDPSQGATNNPSDKSTAPNSSTSAPNEDELRKKIKLLKLKKKLEQNHQNSAANKIQTQWKKAKDKAALARGKPSGSSTAAGTETTPEPEQASTGESLDAAGNAASDSNTTADAEGGDTGPTNTSSLSSKTSTGDKKEPLDKASSNGAERTQSGSKPDTTATESASGDALHNTATGDSGKPESADSDGDEDAQVEKAAKKKKKKNKAKEGSSSNSSNEAAGVVPAPTREVVLRGKNISVKKARKAIEVGMRVKVRFATNGFKVKKDGRKVSKKIYYGGRVTAKSTLGTKIKIKYDDGTSELAKFPDKDVVVDAVGNGEHAVPADDFLPSEPETPEEPKEITSREKPPTQDAGKETEEGEIPSTTPSDAIEDGEVEETDRKPSGGHAQRQIMEAREDKDDNTGDAPTTPPPEVSRTDDGGDERMSPAPSPEEGELSPGITVTKSGETDSQIQIQQQQNSSILVESKPFAFESQPVARQKQPLAETSTSSNKDVVSVSAEAEKNQTTVLESPSKPRAPKKLSIRIPSLATIKAKNLSSPKSGSNSPTASSSNTASGNKMDDVLADTPESKTMEKSTSKRKRTSEVITPSTDDASTEAAPEPPVKRRIKVAIGKGSLHESDVFAASDVIVAVSADDGSTKAKLPAVKEDGLEEMDLAPIADETIGETKKKKKKAERAKSPRPKSPLAKPASSGQLVKNNSTEAAKDKPQIGSSRGSAFDKKSSKDDESKLKETLLVASSLAESRTRKAAVDAKEKMLARQKAKLAAKELKEKEDALPESGKKKKKRRRQEDVEEQKPDSETEQNDPEWVQCDSCMKWRVLPDNVKVSSLPELWYCHMNIYDKKRNNCEAQEQTSKEALKERKERKRRLKLKKRARREAEMAESKQVKKGKQQDEEMPMNAKKKSKLEKLNAEKQTPRSTSPKPGKTIKTKGATADSKRAIAEAKRANLEGGKKSKVKLEEASPTDSGSDTKKEGKKKGKKAKKEVQESSDIQDSETSADGKKRKRGRPARNQTTAVVPSTSNEKEDEDNVEWVQCDKCQKWRKLPAHISADELGQFWNCAMNTWNPDSASCEADEDKTDAHHQEVGVLEWQLRQTHAGKYSYRQMIFGPTARKSNRPPSEKARAAESLFVMPSNDETQYTKSSAFLPRVSNFNKNNATEEKTLNIFDVLGNSNLWDELTRIDPKPAKILSSNFANIPGYANTTKMIKTYECLTNEIKHAMQDVVLQTLEFGCLTADEVIGKAQWFPYEAGVSGGLKAYCNPEIIIHTLLDLVRDGIVEMNTVRDAYLPITEWIPKYRRVGTRRAIEAVEAIKASRCMKIAKPWKQRSNKPTEEWVTGVPRS